jgi:hypothetical protein
MTKSRDEVVREMYLNGASYDEIREIYGVARGTVYRWVSKMGLVKLKYETPQYENLSGQKFGDVEVLCHVRTGRYKNGGTYQLWKCKCLRCGMINNVRAGNLKRGQKSCKRCASKNLSETTKVCLIDYNVWFAMVRRCQERGIDITVTQQECLDIYNAQNGLCALSGVPIYFGERRRDESTASPDRIDPNIGYIKENIRWVHKFVNSMRNNKSTEEFLWWCKTVYENNKDKIENCYPPNNVAIKL